MDRAFLRSQLPFQNFDWASLVYAQPAMPKSQSYAYEALKITVWEDSSIMLPF